MRYFAADRKELGGIEDRGERKGSREKGTEELGWREKSWVPVPNLGKEGAGGDAGKFAGLGYVVK